MSELARYFDLPNPGLSTYLTMTEKGQPVDYRPPFWHGRSRADVLAAWSKEYTALGLPSKYPGLTKFEMDMKAKVGPMSIQAPLKSRIQSIESYYTSIQRDSVPVKDSAIDAVKEYFRPCRGITLRSVEDTVDHMRKNTNSGSPYFGKRNRYTEATLENLDPDTGYVRGYDNAAVLGWRGQEGGPLPSDVKQRVVWMMPYGLNICELRVYQPLIESIQKFNLIPAYVSMDAVDLQISKLFQSKGKDQAVVGTDFTAFDQHFGPHMTTAARDSISSLLVNADGWLDHIYPQKYTIPLVCSERLIKQGLHGMGSGSGGTNADECFGHKALQYEAAIEHHSELNPYSMAYGDDGLITYPGCRVRDVTEAYVKHGMEMNLTKQYVSAHDCIFLRHYHSQDYVIEGVMVGVYSTFRALGRLLAQERYYDPDLWGPEMVTLRAWSILENCKWHPAFEEFVRFVQKGDRYRLGLDLPGFIGSVGKLADKAISEIPDFLGYTRTLQGEGSGGIQQWRIYKMLASQEHS